MPSRFGRAARSGVINRVLQQQASKPTRAAFPSVVSSQSAVPVASRQYATAVPTQIGQMRVPEDYVAPTQPPSARQAQFRKTQLLRQYTSMLRSTPLILFLQHNNLTAVEFTALRRELRAALLEVPVPAAGPDGAAPVDIAESVQLKVMRTGILDMAFRIVEFFDAKAQPEKPNAYTHDLSQTAFDAVRKAKIDDPNSIYAQIKPLMAGQIAALTFPVVSPAHLAAALKILAPSKTFPAPSRKKAPGYYEANAQSALQKVLMLGGRVENKVFDDAGIAWVGGIDGGLDAMRSQLVTMLQSAGMGLTTALEGQSKGLWMTMESRRTQMEEEANGGKKE